MKKLITIYAIVSLAFLCMLSACTPVENSSPMNQPTQWVELKQGDDRIDVTVNGKPFTSYLYGKQLRYENNGPQATGKPILYPIYSSSGIMVNRGFPLTRTEGETTDHPHHSGLFFTYGDLNGYDFWSVDSATQIKHIKVTDMASGKCSGKLSTVSQWIVTEGNKVLLEEKRDMVFIADGDERAIDISITITAQDEKLVFTDNKEGLFAMRVADWLCVGSVKHLGTGRYYSSSQHIPTWDSGLLYGVRERWTCMEGQKDGRIIGVGMLQHPTSTNYPGYWYPAGYGLFAAQPLAQILHQTKSRTPEKNPKAFNLTLEPGQSAFFRYRVIIYDYPAPDIIGSMEKRFDKFVQ